MSQILKIAQNSTAFEDPHDCTDASDVLTIFHAVFDTLIKRDGTSYVPHLAQGWTVSDAARLWRFTLRDGVQFHDGNPVDAEAVCANLRRLSQPDKGYTLGSPGVWHQFLGRAQFRVISTLEFEIVLQDSLADLLDILVQSFILSPACFDKDLSGLTIGSGPYVIEEITPDRIRARANPTYFAGPVPHDHVEWQAHPDPEVRLRKLNSGDVQVANRLPAAEQQPQVTQVDYMAPVAIIYLFNITTGPLADTNLRRALNIAVDRRRLIDDVLDGAAVPLTGFISDVHFGAGASETAFDPDLARALMQKAGYPDGLTLTVSCPNRLPDEAQRLTACLADQFSDIGVTLNVTTHTDREAYAHGVRLKQIGDLAVFDSSPLSTFRVIYEKLDARIAGAWWQGYENLDVQDLLDQARGTEDEAQRAALYREAYAEISRDPPWLFLYNPIRRIGLHGVHPDFKMPDDGVLDVTRLPKLA